MIDWGVSVSKTVLAYGRIELAGAVQYFVRVRHHVQDSIPASGAGKHKIPIVLPHKGGHSHPDEMCRQIALSTR